MVRFIVPQTGTQQGDFPMWFRSARQTRSARPDRFCPRLEALEDRCLLSAGALDPTFGSGAGYVTTAPSKTFSAATAALIQPDGKIIAAGDFLAVTGPKKHGVTPTADVFGLARYNTDGGLDTAFGSGGVAQGNLAIADTFGESAVLYPNAGTANDGKIVVEDYANGEIAIERFNANGTLDTAFGSGGTVLTSFSVGSTLLSITSRGVVLTNAGEIVAVGDNGTDYVLARYNADGSLDSTFGTGGKVITAFTSNTYEETIAQQPDGKLVVAGETGSSWQVVRYNANGSLDTNFGTGGVVTTPFASVTYIRGLAIYPNDGTPNDGRILVVRPGGMVRYNADGTLDSTFGTGGQVSLTKPDSGLALSADGKPVVAGISASGLDLMRFNSDGTPDTTFGAGGIVTTTIATYGGAVFLGLALQSNGDIVVAGTSHNAANTDVFMVARFLPSEPEIGSFTANPNPVTSGRSTTLTASNITDGNPGATITQVAFYVQINGVNTLLGYGTQTSPGMWTFNYTVNLAPGTYTLFAQAEDSYGVFGDPLALSLTVQ
jgi:uncharacterized delta-60 repeat protein